MNFEVRHTPGCVHVEAALRLAIDVASSLVPDGKIRDVTVSNLEEARRLGFTGSPTILVDGLDVAGVSGGEASLGDRLYDGMPGLPERWLVEAAVLRSVQPSHILFLCVANSARSQMAEGIARSLAPRSVAVSSAGSEPTLVRPEAVTALSEIGIDISQHSSTSADDVDAAQVKAVITLCDEEVCPSFLGEAMKMHWGLPDPGHARGGDDAILDSFRQVRDELHRRLSHLFKGWVF